MSLPAILSLLSEHGPMVALQSRHGSIPNRQVPMITYEHRTIAIAENLRCRSSDYAICLVFQLSRADSLVCLATGVCAGSITLGPVSQRLSTFWWPETCLAVWMQSLCLDHEMAH